MSLTVADIKTLFNTYIGDDSTDRLTDSERRAYFTEATAWLLEELGNEHMNASYPLNYLDSVHRYRITTAVADLLTGADLRRDEDDHTRSFSRKSPREIWEEIGQESYDPSWAIERYDGEAYLVINFDSKHRATTLSALDSITDQGTWAVDATGSDATNLTTDSNEYKQGTGSINFDLDVSQSGNNIATVYAPDATSADLSHLEDLGSFLLWVYIPDSTDTTSVTITWSSDASATPSTITNYWSATTTTDYLGNALSDGWNRVKVDWQDSTLTGSPDSSDIVYYQFDVNYGAGQGDDTDYRFDDFKVVQPEDLTFHYISYNVGTNTGGTDIVAYTADTDIPFYSGQYDQYKHVVAHKAASLAFYSALRLRNEGALAEAEAQRALDRYRKNFESSKTRELKSFKVHGVNLRRQRRRRRIRVN